MMVPCPVPHFVIEAVMRTNPNLLKCVAYVGIETDHGFVPLGTGFIVSVPHTDQYWFNFLVTAKHIIDDYIHGDTLWVRVNRLSGVAQSIPLQKDKMISHIDPRNDIALFGFPQLAVDVYDYRTLRLGRDRLEQARSEFWDMGIGDEVVAFGLYTSHHGTTKNIPVTRIGNIALLPEEPVMGPGGQYVDAYLIELRTIAGLSGSPVFVNPPTVQVRDGQLKYIATGIPEGLVPLGVLVGYHVVESAEDQVIVSLRAGETSTEAHSTDQRNTGFGVVIPIERVLDIVERPEIQIQLQNIYEQHVRTQQGFKYID